MRKVHGTDWLLACGLVLSILYLLQVASPLRLYGDGIDYLVHAERILEGSGFRAIDHGIAPGYPALLAFLAWVGLGASWVFISVNLVCLAIGLAATYAICRSVFRFTPLRSAAILNLTLLSWVFVKHSTLTLTDVPFFGLSMSALAVLSMAETRKSFRWWCAAAALSVVALTVRTIGVALIPALGWAWGAQRKPTDSNPSRWNSLTVSLGVFVAMVLALGSSAVSGHISMSLHYYQAMGGLPNSLVTMAGFRLKELGELVANLPLSKAPDVLSAVYPLIGGLGLFAIVRGGWERRREGRAVDIYLVTYALMVCSVPALDARCWLPVIPLLLCWIVPGFARAQRVQGVERVLIGYGVWYAVLGVAALSYSTYVSFAGSRFPEIYGDGTLRTAYRVAWGQSDSIEMSERSQVALQLLRRFNRRPLSHVTHVGQP